MEELFLLVYKPIFEDHKLVYIRPDLTERQLDYKLRQDRNKLNASCENKMNEPVNEKNQISSIKQTLF